MDLGKDQPTELSDFVTQLTNIQVVLRGYIYTMIPNVSDIRDVLQNTNLYLWEHRDDFEKGTNFKAWAFSVARYRCFEHRNKMKKEGLKVFDEQLINLIEDAQYDWDASKSERKHHALAVCLTKLKAKDKDLITARYSTKTPLNEYSQYDGRSPGSLRVVLNRLRTVLRQCIDKKLATGATKP